MAPKRFWRTEADNSYITDMYRNPIPVGHYNLFNILDAGNHTFRPDIVGILYLLNVASAGILVVAAKCFEHLADSDIQRKQGVRNRRLLHIVSSNRRNY